MKPSTEFRELLTRSRRMFDAALLLVITAALLIVSGGTLFCTIFITAFTMGRNTIDRGTTRVAVEREATFDVLKA